MRPSSALRTAAALLLLTWSAAVVCEWASLVAAAREPAGRTSKALLARKSSPSGNGLALRREPSTAMTGLDPTPLPASGSRDDRSQPAYLRVFSPGMPHGHRDPPA